MPRTKSAKRARTKAEKNRLYNLEYKTKLKKDLKAARKSKSEKDFKETASLLDKMVGKKIVHKNKAARLKSRLAKKIKPKK